MTSSGGLTHLNNNTQYAPASFDYNDSKIMHSLSHSLLGGNSANNHLIGPQHHLTSPLNGTSNMGGYVQQQPQQNTSPLNMPLPGTTPQNYNSVMTSGGSLNNSANMKQELSPLSNSTANSLLTAAQPQQLSGGTEGSPSSGGAGSIPLNSAAHLSSGAGTGGGRASNHNTPGGGGGDTTVVAGSNTPLTTGGSSLGVTDHQQFENDKKVIFNHPLFPLLQLLFDKCETATNSAECASSASFDLDIENFIHLHERDKKPFYSDNADVNDVMIRAIQVLRIHLLELEKVNELCKDFCQRYIACLKNKMQSDTLLGCGAAGAPGGALSPTSLHHQYPLSDSPNSQLQLSNCGLGVNVSHHNALSNTPSGGPHLSSAQLQQQQGGGGQQQGHLSTASSAASAAAMHAALYPQLSMFPGMAAAAAAASAANFPGYHSPQGHAPPPGTPHSHPHPGSNLHNGGPGGMLSGSTPISQVGLQHPHHHGVMNGGAPPGVSPLHPHHPHHHLLGGMGGVGMGVGGHQEMNPDGSFKKTKRGVLPKHATQIMRQWLFQHIVHPYPTEDEKRQIAVQTNLTLLQVNNWFINARRRILQPMLEASNPESVNKTKKNKNNNRPTAVNRFWPDNLAQGQITNSFKGSGGGGGDDTSPHSDDNEGESPPPPNHSHGHRGAEEGGTTGSGNNNNNHHHLSPNNRTTLGHEGIVMNGTRDNNSMNNLQLLNSPGALSDDCSDDQSSNEVTITPPPPPGGGLGNSLLSNGGVRGGGGHPHSTSTTTGASLSAGGSFLTNGYDAYSAAASVANSQSQAASLFAAQTSAI